jgi:hypothetical protein
MPSRDRYVDAVGVRGRSLEVIGEVSAGVPRCPVARCVIAGWDGTVASERASLAVEKSADAVVPAGIVIAGKG